VSGPNGFPGQSPIPTMPHAPKTVAEAEGRQAINDHLRGFQKRRHDRTTVAMPIADAPTETPDINKRINAALRGEGGDGA